MLERRGASFGEVGSFFGGVGLHGGVFWDEDEEEERSFFAFLMRSFSMA